MTTGIYRNQKGTISWTGYDGVSRKDDIVVDPPEYILEKFGDKLERLDDEDGIDRGVLRRLRYRELQRIAASDAYDEIHGNCRKVVIIDHLARDDEDVVDDADADADFDEPVLVHANDHVDVDGEPDDE